MLKVHPAPSQVFIPSFFFDLINHSSVVDQWMLLLQLRIIYVPQVEGDVDIEKNSCGPSWTQGRIKVAIFVGVILAVIVIVVVLVMSELKHSSINLG
jgi:hypothetical protein